MKYLKVWTSFLELMQTLEYDEIGRLFEMMLTYAERGKEPESFNGNERFLWPVAKQQIDLTAERNETLRANGMKGGRPKTNRNQGEPNETKQNQSDPDKSCKEKKSNGREYKEKEQGNNHHMFVVPTVDDIEAYCLEKGIYGFDAQKFVDYYTSNGWMVGRSRMKDWRAAVRTWMRNDEERERQRRAASDDLPY